MKVRLERTNDRLHQNLWCGQCYLGAVERRQITLMEHAYPLREEIQAQLPASCRSMKVLVGVPAIGCLPAAAPTKKTATRKRSCQKK